MSGVLDIPVSKLARRFSDQGAAKTTTAGYTMASWHRSTWDVTGGSLSPSLPSSPSAGDKVEVVLASTAAAHTLTVGSYVLSTAGEVLTLTWTGSAWLSENTTVATLDTRYIRDGQPVYALQNHGCALDGTTDDTAAINALIAAVSSAGGGEISGRYGATAKITSSIIAKSNVKFNPAITIVPTSAVTTAVILGQSGDTVTNWTMEERFLTIDGQWSVTANSISGIQLTNGVKPNLQHFAVKNCGGAGILCQGLGSGGGTSEPKIEDVYIDGTGLADGTTGFGILVKDASPKAQIVGNHVYNVKGGMGIGLNGAAGTGFPKFANISYNTIDMQNSTTGFEAIGIVAGCDSATISHNVIPHSYDNGISASAAHCTIVGNVIDMTVNHGIESGGNYNTIIGNTIRNCGQAFLTDGLAYGGVALFGTIGNTVMGNTIIDDQGTHTMTYGVKLQTSGGGNRIGPNYVVGQITGGVTGAVSSDYVIDSTTWTDGYYLPKAHFDTIHQGTTGTAMQIADDTRLQSRVWVGSTANGLAQMNLYTNAGSTRPNVNFCLVTGQAADLWQALAADNSTVLANMTKTGRIGSTDGISTKDLGDVTSKTSAQIDALFAAVPPDGTVATALISSTPVHLSRRNGKWNSVNLSLIS